MTASTGRQRLTGEALRRAVSIAGDENVVVVSDASSRRRQTFPRSHRLKRRRLIRALFDRRRADVGTVAVGCLRLVFRRASVEEVGAEVPLQIGFSPGRCPTAVARNRVRRVLREVYRTHQDVLVDPFRCRPEVLTVMVLYRGAPSDAGACVPRDLPCAMEQVANRLTRSAAEGT